jgi:5-(aminomethyl)-3-furanmethanol phosphate kinase
MGDDTRTVVKVGGSLFDWPELGDRLNAWLAQLEARHVLLIPGGGATADAIRRLDRVHPLGADAGHWLAIRAMSVNAAFLGELVPSAPIVSDLLETRLQVLDALAFFRADEGRADHLPAGWHVTSDSLAVRAATLLKASELILLKSVDWHDQDWTQAMHAGIVDDYFCEALQQAPTGLRVRVVNLRSWQQGPIAAGLPVASRDPD